MGVSTPYTPPDPGTAVLFPPVTGVLGRDNDNPDLAAAVDALYFADESRWPEEGGTNVPLKTWLVDSPDGNAVANWLAATVHPSWLPGVVAPAPITDAAGTVPYVNPANTSAPDGVYAVNYLIDHIS